MRPSESEREQWQRLMRRPRRTDLDEFLYAMLVKQATQARLLVDEFQAARDGGEKLDGDPDEWIADEMTELGLALQECGMDWAEGRRFGLIPLHVAAEPTEGSTTADIPPPSARQTPLEVAAYVATERSHALAPCGPIKLDEWQRSQETPPGHIEGDG